MIDNMLKFPLLKNTKNVPLVKWVNEPETLVRGSMETMRKMKSNWRHCNYGIVTGAKNQIFVLDLDFYKMSSEDKEANAFLLAGFTETPDFDTLSVETPSGGLHYYFTYDPEFSVSKQNKPLAIDTRSDGGMIVGPGSQRDGKFYRVLDCKTIKPIPDKLKAWLREFLYNDCGAPVKPGAPRVLPTHIAPHTRIHYDLAPDLIRKIVEGLPPTYWESGNTVGARESGDASFLVWTTGMKILGQPEMWDEFNRIHYGGSDEEFDEEYRDKNLAMWKHCNPAFDGVANLLKHTSMRGAMNLINYHKMQPVPVNKMKPDFTYDDRRHLGWGFYGQGCRTEPPAAAVERERVIRERRSRKLKADAMYGPVISLLDHGVEAQRIVPAVVELEDAREEDRLHETFLFERALSHNVPRQLEYKNMFVKSDCGTGKTATFCQHACENNLTFLSIVSRRTLGETQRNEWTDETARFSLDCQYYTEVHPSRDKELRDSLICQIDSLAFKLPDAPGMVWDNVVVYLDEYDSLIEHLTRSETMHSNRSLVWEYFVHILTNCKQIICTDADISDKSIDFMRVNGIAKPFELHHNRFKANSSVQATEITSQEELVIMMRKTKKWLCPTDSKTAADVLAIEFPDAVVVTKDTLHLPDFDQHDRVIFSPKVTYGIDSQMEREVFCLFHEKSITPTGMLQMICRCRRIVRLSFCFLRKQFKPSSETLLDVRQRIEEDNAFGCKYFKYEWGGNHSAAYLEMLSRFEYDRVCYLTNPFAHCVSEMRKRGWNVKLVYHEAVKSAAAAASAKELRLKQLDDFDPTEERYERVLSILKLPADEAEPFKMFIMDDKRLNRHWHVCNFFVKDALDVFENFDSEVQEFNVQKIHNARAKCKWLNEVKTAAGCPNPESLDLPHGLTPEQSEKFTAEYKVIFNRTTRTSDFTNRYDLQKTVVQAYKTLFGGECLPKPKRGGPNREYQFTVDITAFDQDKQLYDIRNTPKADTIVRETILMWDAFAELCPQM